MRPWLVTVLATASCGFPTLPRLASEDAGASDARVVDGTPGDMQAVDASPDSAPAGEFDFGECVAPGRACV
jgi:hypothetical protein